MGAVRAIGRTSVTIDTLVWTPIIAPAYGGRFTLTPRAAGGAVKFRTDDTNSGTEFTLNPGISKIYETRIGRHPQGSSFGFITGETVIYAKAVTGVGPVDVDWS